MSDDQLHGLSRDIVELLESRMKRGGLMLFTGAGFSRDTRALDGQPVPGVSGVKSLLWPIAFGSDPEDPASSLADVYECAVGQSETRVADVLNRALRIGDQTLPDMYRVWFSVPWARIYTLNIDDLDEAVSRHFALPRPISSVSATHAVPNSNHDLWSVHLNGRLDDLPHVTFSPMQYGRRLPGRDPWYSTLTADLVGNSFVFVGTTLDEPPLWEHLELRGERGTGRELRPRSFLVTPELSVARARMLRNFNITHIPLSASQFADVLATMQLAAEEGHRLLSERRERRNAGKIVCSVTELRAEQPPGLNLGHFLLGREPHWRDVIDGYAIERTFEHDLLADGAMLEPRVVLLTGTAGTGKSTALRRIALSLEADGKTVGWIDQSLAEVGIPRIREAVLDAKFDYVMIDDVDSFGDQAGPMLRTFALKEDGPRVVATARSTRSERFQIWDRIKSLDSAHVVAPPLTDSDIDGLIGSLSAAGLLGQLAGKTIGQQRQVFLQLSGRQLLVAMIEATSGAKFEDKIDDECAQLPREQAHVYAIAALASRNRLWLSLDELLTASGEANQSQLQVVDALKRQHLLVDAGYGGLAVRHRVVAEQVISWFRRQGRLASPIEGLIFAMAIQTAKDPNPSSRPFRVLIRLLNHRFLWTEVGDRDDVRSIYESAASLLQDNSHYWLQRGAFETQNGDLAVGENFLSQARALAPEDYRVRTEWGLLSLKRAAEWAQARQSGWLERSQEAIADLRDVIETRGGQDPYPYHVLGSQGLHFVRRAPLSPSEKAQTLDMLRKVVARGCVAHPMSDGLKQLRDDLETEYLSLAVDQG